MSHRAVVCSSVIGLVLTASLTGVAVAATAPLVVEAKISLGEVRGRIDHLAIDLERRRLYVAELGNDSIGVVDLAQRKTLRTLGGFSEPQGIGYEPATDALYVANGGDGAVKILRASDLASLGTIKLGDDADNVRIDADAHRVWVGYGNGALAAIDPISRKQVGNIPLAAHPESFRLVARGPWMFVNVPDAAEIALVDRTHGRQVATWKTGRLQANFPMSLDDADRLLVVFRSPPELAIYRSADGTLLQSLRTCSDADDVFFDAPRRRVYVSCGQGYVEVFEREGTAYRFAFRLKTQTGARTSLFVPQLDRLFLAVRATSSTPAAIWVIRPAS
jgi:hypothetical protein